MKCIVSKKSKFKVGDEVCIISNTVHHNFPIGSIKTIKIINVKEEKLFFKGCSNYAAFKDVELVKQDIEYFEEDIEYFEELKKEYESELELINRKIEYLKETGAKKLDEIEFKVYNTIKVLKDSKKSEKQQAKEIAKLFK